MDVAICDIALEGKGQLAFLETECGLVTNSCITHPIQFSTYAGGGSGQAGALFIADTDFITDEPAFLLIQSTAPIDFCSRRPVSSVDILWTIGSHTRQGIVNESLHPGIICYIGINIKSYGLVYTVSTYTIS